MLKNLFSDLPELDPAEAERVDELARGSQMHVERIVSRGQSSPDGFWYDSEQDEWVAVLRGEGKLRFESTGTVLHMKPGDLVNIPAHTRHRVDWTTSDEPTVVV